MSNYNPNQLRQRDGLMIVLRLGMATLLALQLLRSGLPKLPTRAEAAPLPRATDSRHPVKLPPNGILLLLDCGGREVPEARPSRPFDPSMQVIPNGEPGSADQLDFSTAKQWRLICTDGNGHEQPNLPVVIPSADVPKNGQASLGVFCLSTLNFPGDPPSFSLSEQDGTQGRGIILQAACQVGDYPQQTIGVDGVTAPLPAFSEL